MEYKGFGLVCGDGDWFVYCNGKLIAKVESDTEAIELIDTLLDNEEHDG